LALLFPGFPGFGGENTGYWGYLFKVFGGDLGGNQPKFLIWIGPFFGGSWGLKVNPFVGEVFGKPRGGLALGV